MRWRQTPVSYTHLSDHFGGNRAAEVRGRIQEECYPLQTAYDYFCDEFENMLGAAFGVAPAVEGLGETESDAKDLLRSTISATAVSYTHLLRFHRFRFESIQNMYQTVP